MTEQINYVSLFAGIGGIDIGFDRAGMRCVAQVEIDPYCRRVLSRHWPEAAQHDDVRTFPEWWKSEPRPPVHAVCAGFPCQPFSEAGLHLGVKDPRWGWPWTAAAIRVLRPRYVLLENSNAIVRNSRAFGEVLGDLASLGFDAEWGVLSACAVGAPHTRERLFLLAYPQGERIEFGGGIELPESGDPERNIHHWKTEPEPHRVADGVPFQVDRNRTLGNAVVPPIAERFGRIIVASHEKWSSRADCTQQIME